MELNSYQQKAIAHLSSYLECLNQYQNMALAWKEYWLRQDIRVGFNGMAAYQDVITGVPYVCLKVPTGGGKTFLACASVKRIFDAFPSDKPKVVVWLVPSEAILSQTVRALENTRHPYRQRLDSNFSGRVGVYTKEELLNGQNFSPDSVRNMLTVCVLSYDSLRIDHKKKDGRKVYQENGNLLQFAEYFQDQTVLLADTPETALIQVLRQVSPVTIVDESHNAASTLSIEMLCNLNPAFILNLTATPRKESNIIAYIDAMELKKENMVKLPVMAYNCPSRNSVIQNAVQLRGALEAQAILEEQEGWAYIRPIVLFQAQPNLIGKNSETCEKIRLKLIEIGIPEQEIAVKTAQRDDIKSTNLLNRDCKIRYIITVNALKEGWDCSFAYILASLANKTSTVDVEQIVGRILRQPYAKQNKSAALNMSYVLICSNDFRNTLEHIVDGLNYAGFSGKDYRVGKLTTDEPEQAQPQNANVQITIQDAAGSTLDDDFRDIDTNELRGLVRAGAGTVTESTLEMLHDAECRAQDYNTKINSDSNSGYTRGGLGQMLTQNAMRPEYKDDALALRIPQFFLEKEADLFGDKSVLLEREALSDGFSLLTQDAQVNFGPTTEEIYRIDVQGQDSNVPTYIRAARGETEYLHKVLSNASPEKKRELCIRNISNILNKNNRFSTQEITGYVQRVFNGISDEELSVMDIAFPAYAKKIQDKIYGLEEQYQEAQFYRYLDSGKIICQGSYVLPAVITAADTISSIPHSLYSAEKNDINNFEWKLITNIAQLDNIEWWHRILGKTGFRINGFINHFPDFMVKTKSGRILLIEGKGDDRDNSNSESKLKLGRKWQEAAGERYRYFMVFEHTEFSKDGAYTLDSFMSMAKDL